jgi:hypothetical protein
MLRASYPPARVGEVRTESSPRHEADLVTVVLDIENHGDQIAERDGE